MRLFQPISINQKLTRLVTVAVATALLLSYAAFVINDVRIARRSLVEQMSVLADVLAANATAALEFDDEKSAEQVLASLRMEPSVESACIFNVDGSRFATYVRSGSVSPEAPSSVPTGGSNFSADGHLNLITPMLADGEPIGTFQLHATMHDVCEQLVSYSLSMGVVLLVSFGLAYLLAARLQKGISEPILALAHAAERISAEQNYSIRVRRFTDDELGVLYDEFNHMLEQVESSRRALEAANERLSKHSAERMRAIVETAADGIITFSDDGTIDSCNGASCELLRAASEELIGSNFGSILPAAAGVAWKAFLEQQLDGGRAQNRGARQFDARRKDGTSIPVLISLSAFPTDRGRAFTAILRDLTEYQRLHQELAQAQNLESIGQLVAGIAHEINTPMQFIGDNIRFLRECIGQLMAVLDKYDQLLDPSRPEASWSERRRLVEELKRQTRFDFNREQIGQAIEESLVGVDRIIQIVRAMKRFSQSGVEQNVAVDLNDAIRSTATITRCRWKYVADVELELDPNLPPLMCLPAEINQVLLNLVVNAADAITDKIGHEPDAKGKIVVRTKTDGEQIVVEVADNGCGIPEQGTGQGLAIAHDVVVNRLHGTIQVESSPGTGTTFIVRLPLGDNSKPAKGSNAKSAVVVSLDSNAVDAHSVIH
jgi:two-component system NtrC family sensor kinase